MSEIFIVSKMQGEVMSGRETLREKFVIYGAHEKKKSNLLSISEEEEENRRQKRSRSRHRQNENLNEQNKSDRAPAMYEMS